jgi:ADP-ribosyl-[dinitrogen reductase] hydrolase
MAQVNDRKRGVFYGLAIGDALGAAVEFRMPGEFAPVTCYRGGGPHGLRAGEWTDDTSMALALADSMGRAVFNDGWDLYDQVGRYLDWWKNGKYSVNGFCFDIGTTTRHALNEFVETGDVETCADRSPESSGNGSIMRLAPVPIRFAHMYPGDIPGLSKKLAESSITTHGSDQCISACKYLGLILAGLIGGAERGVVLSADWPALSQIRPLDPLVEELIKPSKSQYDWRGKTSPKEVKASGWVINTLEAALWAFSTSQGFEEAVLKAVNLGDDADTVGAVTGQLAGAYWGLEGIPESLVLGLARKDMIEAALKSLGVE